MSNATLKPIPGCPGYFVGDDGIVWSSMRGQGGRYEALHQLRPYRDRDGYLHVTLYVDGRKRRHAVHQLVAIVFVGLCPAGMVVRHRNGNPSDNSAKNLLYGTQAQNIADRDAHGTTAKGSRVHLAKLVAEQVLEIMRRLEAGERQADIARAFGVSDCAITDLKKGRTWRHLTAVAKSA